MTDHRLTYNPDRGTVTVRPIRWHVARPSLPWWLPYTIGATVYLITFRTLAPIAARFLN